MKNELRHDDKDTAILDELVKNGRLAVAVLGRKVGLSQPAMSERLKRLLLNSRGLSGRERIGDNCRLHCGIWTSEHIGHHERRKIRKWMHRFVVA